MKVYVIGSLRNPRIPEIANELREKLGCEVFDDWHAAGPHGDDHWRDYEKARGRTYLQALEGYAAEHVFSYDRKHLDEADAAVLVLPAGKSAHLEAGYMLGRGKRVYILLDDPERWDVMYKFATLITDSFARIVQQLQVDDADPRPGFNSPLRLDGMYRPYIRFSSRKLTNYRDDGVDLATNPVRLPTPALTRPR